MFSVLYTVFYNIPGNADCLCAMLFSMKSRRVVNGKKE